MIGVLVFGMFLGFMFYRNIAVHRFQDDLLSEAKAALEADDIERCAQLMHRYERRPHYLEMVLQFWVWPLSKFEEE